MTHKIKLPESGVVLISSPTVSECFSATRHLLSTARADARVLVKCLAASVTSNTLSDPRELSPKHAFFILVEESPTLSTVFSTASSPDILVITLMESIRHPNADTLPIIMFGRIIDAAIEYQKKFSGLVILETANRAFHLIAKSDFDESYSLDSRATMTIVQTPKPAPAPRCPNALREFGFHCDVPAQHQFFIAEKGPLIDIRASARCTSDVAEQFNLLRGTLFIGYIEFPAGLSVGVPHLAEAEFQPGEVLTVQPCMTESSTLRYLSFSFTQRAN